jgi:hypothetical protein
MRDENRLMLSYFARLGIGYRVKNGTLQLRNADALTPHDREWVDRIKPRLIEIIDSGERVTDTYKWLAKLDTPAHRARRLR